MGMWALPHACGLTIVVGHTYFLSFHFVEDSFLHHSVLAVDHYVSDTKSGKNYR